MPMSDRRRPRVAVLGAGSWGTTLASIVSRTTPCVLWARSATIADEINSRRASVYLPGVVLPSRVRATTSLEEAVGEADVLVSAVPTQSVRGVLADAAPMVRPWIPVVSVAKGLEEHTHLRVTEIVADVLPGHPAGVLAGPNIAVEVMAGYAAAATIAIPDENLATRLAELFRTSRFRVYSTSDVVGVEIAGALKNIYAIAVGMADGAGAGENTKAMVVTRAAREMSRLGEALGGHRDTFGGLAGFGDLIVTCTSPHSRNRHVGEQLGKGRTMIDILEEMTQVAEGVKTTPVAIELADKCGVGLPIACEVNSVLSGVATVHDAYRGLLRAPAGHETKGDEW
ncbi:MAG: glycerol-3-phosphate dehydrogenase [Pseudonocardiales bacterium]|nr:glycerol-3-phosphate dehydrogenase [Pseudonocardiales bacterium]